MSETKKRSPIEISRDFLIMLPSLVVLFIIMSVSIINGADRNVQIIRGICFVKLAKEARCIHRGSFVNETQCQRLCWKYYSNIDHFQISSTCHYNRECNCINKYIRPPTAESLADLEDRDEHLQMTDAQKRVRQTWGPSQRTRCSYRNELISSRECEEGCQRLNRTASGTIEFLSEPLEWFCEARQGCQCKIKAEDHNADFSVRRLDLLEARCQNILTQNARINIASLIKNISAYIKTVCPDIMGREATNWCDWFVDAVQALVTGSQNAEPSRRSDSSVIPTTGDLGRKWAQ